MTRFAGNLKDWRTSDRAAKFSVFNYGRQSVVCFRWLQFARRLSSVRWEVLQLKKDRKKLPWCQITAKFVTLAPTWVKFTFFGKKLDHSNLFSVFRKQHVDGEDGKVQPLQRVRGVQGWYCECVDHPHNVKLYDCFTHQRAFLPRITLYRRGHALGMWRRRRFLQRREHKVLSFCDGCCALKNIFLPKWTRAPATFEESWLSEVKLLCLTFFFERTPALTLTKMNGLSLKVYI